MLNEESNVRVEGRDKDNTITSGLSKEDGKENAKNVNESNSFTKNEGIEGEKDSIRKDVKRKIEELLKIADDQIEKAKKEKNYILRAVKEYGEGTEQLVQNVSNVYEYKLLTNLSIHTMSVQHGQAIIFFDKMDISIIGDGLEVQLNQGDDPVGMLYLTNENKVEFDKDEWVLKIA